MEDAKDTQRFMMIVSGREAQVIRRLREFSHGEALIKKREDEIFQVLVSQSYLVDDVELPEETINIPNGVNLDGKEKLSIQDINNIIGNRNG